MNLEKKVTLIADYLYNKKAEEVEILYPENSTLADAIVICTVTSKAHSRSIVDYLEKSLKVKKIRIYYKEGFFTSGWMVLDFGDIILHIMEKEKRDFYHLESLYQDGGKVYHY